MSEMQIERVLETCLYGHDLERAACFWWDVLGMVPLSMEAGRHHLFRCGHAVFLLFIPDEITGASDVPAYGATGTSNVAFRTSAGEMKAGRDKLRKKGVHNKAEINWPNGGGSI